MSTPLKGLEPWPQGVSRPTAAPAAAVASAEPEWPDEPSPDEPAPTAAEVRAAAEANAEAQLLAALRDGSWLDAQHFPPIAYAIPGLIPEGFTLLIGPPKAGKSWLALAMLLSAAAEGGYALGCIPTGSAQRVLYLALEDGDRRMQERCRALLGDGNPIPPLFHYQTRILPGRVVDTIEAFLQRHPETVLIVIDTLGKVMPPAVQGESAYQRDYRVGGRLKQIADDHPGIAVVVLHHDRKASSEDFVDSVSGTHGLAGAADTIVVLARARQSAEGILMVTGRDVEESEYALTMVGTAWQLDGSNLDSAAKRALVRRETGTMSDRSAEILELVRNSGRPVSAADVAAKFGDVSVEQARVYLSRLTDSGKITRIKRGAFGPLPTAPSSNPVMSVTSVMEGDHSSVRHNTHNANNTGGSGADGA